MPREAYPQKLDIASSVGEPVVDKLGERGGLVRVQPPWSLEQIPAVSRHSGMLSAAADPRGMQRLRRFFFAPFSPLIDACHRRLL